MVHQTYPESERQIRLDACTAGASAGTELEFVEVGAGRMIHGASLSTLLFMAQVTPVVVEAAKKAQDEGADAVVTLGTLDFGVDAASEVVDIPVVGPGRVGFHLAASISTRIGVLVYEKSNVAQCWRFAQTYGVAPLVTSTKPVEVSIREMGGRKAELKQAIVRAAREQVEYEGAGVIFPQGISMVPVHFSAGELTAEIGVPVLDAMAAAIRVAELLADTGYRERRRSKN